MQQVTLWMTAWGIKSSIKCSQVRMLTPECLQSTATVDHRSSHITCVDFCKWLARVWKLTIFILLFIFYILLTTRKAAWHIILVLSMSLFVCMYVCMSDDNFWKPWRKKFISAQPVHLQGIQVKFVYKGHWVKVKVTVAKRLQKSAHALINFRWQFSSALTRWCHRPCIMGGPCLRLEGNLVSYF